jgi:nucleotide-binding universal stress UspA family protein
MKKILVPTDFSDCAEYATDAAIAIAMKTGAEILFLHLTAVPIDWKNLPKDQEQIYPDITRRVNKINSSLDEMISKADSKGVAASRSVYYNEGYGKIIDCIRDEGADFVVMGSHGAGALKEFFVGSTTQKVARLSPVPVLALRKPFNQKNISNIVFPSDFSEEILEPFMKVVDFARLLDAKIHLVFINTPFNFTDTATIKQKMGNYALHAPGLVESTNVYNSFEFEDGLKEFCAEKCNGDIIAMITHGRKGFSRLYTGSLTESVINHLDLPVLSIKTTPEKEDK